MIITRYITYCAFKMHLYEACAEQGASRSIVEHHVAGNSKFLHTSQRQRLPWWTDNIWAYRCLVFTQVLSCKLSKLSHSESDKGVSNYSIVFSPALLFLVILRHAGQQQTLYTQPTSKQFLSQITRVYRIHLFWEQSEVTANQQSLKSNLSRHPLLMAYHIYLNISIHKMDDVSCCPFEWFS